MKFINLNKYLKDNHTSNYISVRTGITRYRLKIIASCPQKMTIDENTKLISFIKNISSIENFVEE